MPDKKSLTVSGRQLGILTCASRYSQSFGAMSISVQARNTSPSQRACSKTPSRESLAPASARILSAVAIAMPVVLPLGCPSDTTSESGAFFVVADDRPTISSRPRFFAPSLGDGGGGGGNDDNVRSGSPSPPPSPSPFAPSSPDNSSRSGRSDARATEGVATAAAAAAVGTSIAPTPFGSGSLPPPSPSSSPSPSASPSSSPSPPASPSSSSPPPAPPASLAKNPSRQIFSRPRKLPAPQDLGSFVSPRAAGAVATTAILCGDLANFFFSAAPIANTVRVCVCVCVAGAGAHGWSLKIFSATETCRRARHPQSRAARARACRRTGPRKIFKACGRRRAKWCPRRRRSASVLRILLGRRPFRHAGVSGIGRRAAKISKCVCVRIVTGGGDLVHAAIAAQSVAALVELTAPMYHSNFIARTHITRAADFVVDDNRCR